MLVDVFTSNSVSMFHTVTDANRWGSSELACTRTRTNVLRHFVRREKVIITILKQIDEGMACDFGRSRSILNFNFPLEVLSDNKQLPPPLPFFPKPRSSRRAVEVGSSGSGALANVHSSLPLHSEVMMAQLFQLAVAAHHVTMATTEITRQEVILPVYRFPEGSLF